MHESALSKTDRLTLHKLHHMIYCSMTLASLKQIQTGSGCLHFRMSAVPREKLEFRV